VCVSYFVFVCFFECTTMPDVPRGAMSAVIGACLIFGSCALCLGVVSFWHGCTSLVAFIAASFSYHCCFFFALLREQAANPLCVLFVFYWFP